MQERYAKLVLSHCHPYTCLQATLLGLVFAPWPATSRMKLAFQAGSGRHFRFKCGATGSPSLTFLNFSLQLLHCILLLCHDISRSEHDCHCAFMQVCNILQYRWEQVEWVFFNIFLPCLNLIEFLNSLHRGSRHTTYGKRPVPRHPFPLHPSLRYGP